MTLLLANWFSHALGVQVRACTSRGQTKPNTINNKGDEKMSKECERANDRLTMLGVTVSPCGGDIVTSVYPSGLEIVACEFHTSVIEAGF